MKHCLMHSPAFNYVKMEWGGVRGLGVRLALGRDREQRGATDGEPLRARGPYDARPRRVALHGALRRAREGLAQQAEERLRAAAVGLLEEAPRVRREDRKAACGTESNVVAPPRGELCGALFPDDPSAGRAGSI